MAPMSDDEVVVLVLSPLIAAAAWGRWLWLVVRPRQVRDAGPGRLLLVVMPLVCAVVLFGVLRSWASFDVRGSTLYLGMYVVMGAAWVGLATLLLPLVSGVLVRDDVVERANPAAAVLVSGGLVAVTLSFAGGNIGDGPGWWVVVFSALLATATLFALWWALQLLTGLADGITVDRDRGLAVRVALLLVACGMVLGRAVAGDWESARATLVDFALGAWPVVAFVGLETTVGRWRPPARAETPLPNALAVGFLYLVLAYVWLRWQGPW